ncbi:CdaR family transcriptional regulator [Streptomyces sp. VRA16 Mangrove soil]|uniref:PucR family transcriptional regulator n=1 Tax=Streptomyces sp. VRA16 Mangrove soil TaxID=2817434 RepID=UPI001A9E490C|nr:helix-turn-helix domain-containing protein [Streptomyces sp. VRA16 Mangrove soil]MBO1330352.1 helix-turn-helix domain-containing protein [Streptomyces sp. VRA16 Mangrove soil]
MPDALAAAPPSVRRLADALGPGAACSGRDEVAVADIVVAGPDEPLHDVSGALILAVGVRADEAAAFLGAAAIAGAAAVAFKIADGEIAPDTREAAEVAGLPVLGVPAALRWDRAEAELRAVLAYGGRYGPDGARDLFSLAQTVATLTRGVVSVEDSAHRVVAYAGPGEEADELRRRSVLGRDCPEPYLKLLREQGVYRRVRAGDEVIEVAAQPQLGARARLVIGVNAGRRPLGTIWVQEGSAQLAQNAAQVLRGAARLASFQLVDHYFRGDARARLGSREELSHGLLTGRFDAGALAAHLGVDPAASADVVAVDLRLPTEGMDAQRAEAAGVVSVHAAAHRENALVAQACGQIYAILPCPAAAPADEAPLERWAADLVVTLRRLTGSKVQAVVGGRATRLSDVPAMKMHGYRGLQLMTRTPDQPVASHTRLTPALLVRDTLDLLRDAPHVRWPAIDALVAHDRAHGGDTARSLLRYLDAFGDVATVAKELNVHPNTLRYRIRRAVALTGLDLDDAEHRLAAVLHLRLALDTPTAPDRPFPTR